MRSKLSRLLPRDSLKLLCEQRRLRFTRVYAKWGFLFFSFIRRLMLSDHIFHRRQDGERDSYLGSFPSVLPCLLPVLEPRMH